MLHGVCNSCPSQIETSPWRGFLVKDPDAFQRCVLLRRLELDQELQEVESGVAQVSVPRPSRSEPPGSIGGWEIGGPRTLASDLALWHLLDRSSVCWTANHCDCYSKQGCEQPEYITIHFSPWHRHMVILRLKTRYTSSSLPICPEARGCESIMRPQSWTGSNRYELIWSFSIYHHISLVAVNS